MPSLETRSRWAYMYAGKRLPPEVRLALAERVVRWVVTPTWVAMGIAALAIFATVGLTQPKRLVSHVLALPLLTYATYLARKQRWLPAAAWLCITCFAAIVAGVFVNSIHAPVYGLGFMLLGLVIPLFGLHWGMAAALALVATGVTWLVLEKLGLALAYNYAASSTRMALYTCFMGLTVALLGGIQTMLEDALAEAERRRCEAEAAREAEAASELAFHAVFDQASLGMLLLTPDGLIAQLNHRAAAWLGAEEADDLIGRRLDAVTVWSDQQRELMLNAVRAAASGETSSNEIAVARELGAQHAYQFTVSPFYALGGRLSHVIVEIVDVTEVVQTRQQLGQARRLESLGKLSGGIAHDFNNMLGAILAASELLRTAITKNDVQGRESALEGIESTVRRASSLTRQLLAFGRRDRIASVNVDVGRLLQDSADLLERTLHKNITVQVRQPDPPLFVRGDVAALDHALLNLALNAQDAMPNGGTLTLEAERVEVDSALSDSLGRDIGVGRAVVIRVSDTGTGIADAVRDRLFEPFFTTKAVGKGTGLGLSAVHGTVRNHHGAIRVQTKLGEGSTFELYFPETRDPAVPLYSGIPERPAAPRLSFTVQLAEDETLLRESWTMLLRASGCHVTAHATGDSLLGALAAGAVCDVIITDLVMPGTSGMTLLRRLQAARPECPMVLVTGHAAEDVSGALSTETPSLLLRKPVAYEDLAAGMEAVLAHSMLTSRQRLNIA